MQGREGPAGRGFVGAAPKSVLPGHGAPTSNDNSPNHRTSKTDTVRIHPTAQMRKIETVEKGPLPVGGA